MMFANNSHKMTNDSRYITIVLLWEQWKNVIHAAKLLSVTGTWTGLGGEYKVLPSLLAKVFLTRVQSLLHVKEISRQTIINTSTRVSIRGFVPRNERGGFLVYLLYL